MKITRRNFALTLAAGSAAGLTGCDEGALTRGLLNWVNDPPRVLLVANNSLVYIDFPWLGLTTKVVTVQGINLPRTSAAVQKPPRQGGIDFPDPDEWQFDPWDLPDPEDDFPIPDVPPPDPFDDPFDLPDPPDLPPFPDDDFPISDLSPGDISIIDTGGEPPGYAVKQRAASSSEAAKLTQIHVGAAPKGLRLTPDRKTLLVAQTGGIGIIDYAARKVVGTIPLPSSATPWALDISPDGARAYVSSLDPFAAVVFVVDLTTKQVLATIPVSGLPNSLAVTPDGTQVWVTSYFGDSVMVIDTLTNTPVVTINDVVNAWGLIFNRTGTRAYVTSAQAPFGFLEVIDTSKYAVTGSVQVGNTPRSLAITPSGAHIFVANWGADTVSQIDAATNAVIRTIKVGSQPSGFHFR